MLVLSDIRDILNKISEATASILNMDVMIFDNKGNKIGDSFKGCYHDYISLSEHAILATVIKTGLPIIIRNRSDCASCYNCKYNHNCHIVSLIGVPVIHESTILGGIEIFADKDENRKEFLEKEKHILNFSLMVAELITSKLIEKYIANKLNIIRKQLLCIMNSIDDGIIVVDENGYITYQNTFMKKLNNFSDIKSNPVNIMDWIPKDFINNLINSGAPFNNKEFCVNYNGMDFQTLVSGKTIQLNDRNIGAILTFKKLIEVLSVVNGNSHNTAHTSFKDIIGESPQLMAVINAAQKIANSQSTVLIRGESGTGKELFARAIHESSSRKDMPFVTINCAAIPDNLLESELFGYEEGAFTGAKKGGKTGKFQLSDKGTVFLDEIGEMALHLQAKILRVLQEKTIEKVGGNDSIKIDVRVIAATNKNLEQMVENGQFREDLFYRLNVIPLIIPPLRERQGDIKLLLSHFLNLYNVMFKKDIKGFSSEAENILLNYYWRGNVRELQNVIEYAINMENSLYICVENIPAQIRNKTKELTCKNTIMRIDHTEKTLIENALKLFGDDVNGKKIAAKSLGISLTTLYRKIKLYNIA